MSYPNNDHYQSRKICVFQRALKITTSNPHPTPPPSKVEGIFVPKKSPGYGCYLQLNMPIQQIE